MSQEYVQEENKNDPISLVYGPVITPMSEEKIMAKKEGEKKKTKY